MELSDLIKEIVGGEGCNHEHAQGTEVASRAQRLLFRALTKVALTTDDFKIPFNDLNEAQKLFVATNLVTANEAFGYLHTLGVPEMGSFVYDVIGEESKDYQNVTIDLLNDLFGKDKKILDHVY